MVFDTNILIAYLNGEQPVIDFISGLKREGRALFISSINVAEILALPNLIISDIKNIKQFLSEFISIPFDDALAETAALIKRVYKLGLPDAAIAATALSRKVSLVTRDKQFKKIKELRVISF